MTQGNNNRAILVAVLANGCGACERFKSQLMDNIIKMVDKMDNVSFLKVTYESLSGDAKINPDPHHDVKKMIRFFPTLLLVTEKSWKNRIPGDLKRIMIGGETYSNINDLRNFINAKMKEQPFISDNHNTVRFVLIENSNKKMKFNGDTLLNQSDDIVSRTIR